VPTRCGAQRFGRDGENAARARELLASGRPPRDRRAARFLISALQSEVFNAVLERRSEGIDSVELGDLARVEESGGLFWVDDLDRERPRAADFEISATGPIFGTKVREPRADVGALEREVYDGFGLPEPGTLRLPKGVRARGTRRPLRVRPADLEVEALASGPGLRVRCALPSGSYVTVLLEELVGPVIDDAQARPS
jgi:tRNA pseudouridine13 synthase